MDEGYGDMLSQTPVHADDGMGRLRRQCSSEKRKILFDYLRIFQLELSIVVFGMSFLKRIGTVYIVMKTPYLHIN
jgi:hypothetical protein